MGTRSSPVSAHIVVNLEEPYFELNTLSHLAGNIAMVIVIFLEWIGKKRVVPFFFLPKAQAV